MTNMFRMLRWRFIFFHPFKATKLWRNAFPTASKTRPSKESEK